MIEIQNPRFKLKDDNIFELRKKDWSRLEQDIRDIIKVAEDEGFELVEYEFKDSYSHEIERTLKKNMIIRLKKGEMDIDLSMQVPRLIDNNYIVIGGKKKIPIFQLCDIPLVTRGKNIKIRTNVSSLMLSKNTKLPYMKLSFMSGITLRFLPSDAFTMSNVGNDLYSLQ